MTPPYQSAVDYTWDDNGNLLQRGADTYDWNAGDRMTSATVGGVTTTMAYNGDGLRSTVGLTNTSGDIISSLRAAQQPQQQQPLVCKPPKE